MKKKAQNPKIETGAGAGGEVVQEVGEGSEEEGAEDGVLQAEAILLLMMESIMAQAYDHVGEESVAIEIFGMLTPTPQKI